MWWAVLQAHQERRRGLLELVCSRFQDSQTVDALVEELLDRPAQGTEGSELAPLAASSLELLRPSLTDPLDRVEVFRRNESPEIELLRLREYFR